MMGAFSSFFTFLYLWCSYSTQKKRVYSMNETPESILKSVSVKCLILQVAESENASYAKINSLADV